MFQPKMLCWKPCLGTPGLLYVIALALGASSLAAPPLPERKTPVQFFTAGKEPVAAIAFSPDGTLLATGGNERVVKVWVIQSGQLLHIFRGHTGSVRALTFSADSNTLVSGSADKSVRFWSVETSRLVETHQFEEEVHHVAFSPNGQKLVAATYQGSLILWDFVEGSKQVLKAHPNAIEEVVWSADSKTLRSIETFSFRAPQFWDTSGGVIKAMPLKPRLPMRHTGFTRPRALSPNQKFFVSLDATSFEVTSLRVRDWPGLTERLRVLPDIDQRIGHPNCLVFSPDGKVVVSGCSDGKVYLWDMSWLHELQQDQLDETDTPLNLNHAPQRELEDVSFWGRELLPGVNDGSVVGADGNVPRPTHPKWPALKGPSRGSEILSIENRGPKGVWIALRRLSNENSMKTGQGFDIYIPAGKTTKVSIYGDARLFGTTYDVYAIFDDDPKALYKGDDLLIRHNADYTLTLSAGQGNYGMRKIF